MVNCVRVTELAHPLPHHHIFGPGTKLNPGLEYFSNVYYRINYLHARRAPRRSGPF